MGAGGAGRRGDRAKRDYAMTETLDKLAKKNCYGPAAGRNAKRFSRARAVLAALRWARCCRSSLPPLCVAVTAQPYAYTLQGCALLAGTATWRAPRSAGRRGVSPGDRSRRPRGRITSAWACGFALFPYVSLLGEMTDAASLLFDRVSPLVSLLLPACYAIGYQFGPQRYARTKKAIEEAKSRPRKRLKKEARQRLAGRSRKRRN